MCITLCPLEAAIFNLMWRQIAYNKRTIKTLPTMPHLPNYDKEFRSHTYIIPVKNITLIFDSPWRGKNKIKLRIPTHDTILNSSTKILTRRYKDRWFLIIYESCNHWDPIYISACYKSHGDQQVFSDSNRISVLVEITLITLNT